MVTEYSEEQEGNMFKKHKLKLLIFGIFLLVLSLLIYTSFSGNAPFTGSSIVEEVDESKIKFNAELETIPVLELNGEFKEIRIDGASDSFLYVGDQKFSLGDFSNNYITLKDYDGKIYFNDDNISELKGKAEEIVINGVSLTSKSGKNTKVYFDEDFNHNFLEIKETVLIRELSYNTSGEISLNNRKNLFEIREEKIVINNFQGDLKVESKKLKLNGYLDGLRVIGESDIFVEV